MILKWQAKENIMEIYLLLSMNQIKNNENIRVTGYNRAVHQKDC